MRFWTVPVPGVLGPCPEGRFRVPPPHGTTRLHFQWLRPTRSCRVQIPISSKALSPEPYRCGSPGEWICRCTIAAPGPGSPLPQTGRGAGIPPGAGRCFWQILHCRTLYCSQGRPWYHMTVIHSYFLTSIFAAVPGQDRNQGGYQYAGTANHYF